MNDLATAKPARHVVIRRVAVALLSLSVLILTGIAWYVM